MIFNNNGIGSQELKALIGFIYKSINFNNLRSYIEFAERDIKKVIGPEVFIYAEQHYYSKNYRLDDEKNENNQNPNQIEPQEPGPNRWPRYYLLDELVAKIQYPVAVLAYRRYVPSADLTHSDKGRQIFVSEQEKPAFEWQIEKDNENLLALAHEAIDMLLEFLETNIDIDISDDNPSVIPWRNSDAFEAVRALMIPNVNEFEKVFMIGGSRMTFLSLVPFIKRIQENEIQTSIGNKRYVEILAEIYYNGLSFENLPILDKIRQPLALLALSVAVKRLTVEVLPAGIFSNIVSNVVKGKNTATKQDRNEISSLLERDGLRELVKLQEYCRKTDLGNRGQEFTTIDADQRIDPSQKFVRL